MIEEAAKSRGKKCAEILFEEWGTSGKVRPTLGTLRDIFKEAKIYRAADEIAKLLKGMFIVYRYSLICVSLFLLDTATEGWAWLKFG